MAAEGRPSSCARLPRPGPAAIVTKTKVPRPPGRIPARAPRNPLGTKAKPLGEQSLFKALQLGSGNTRSVGATVPSHPPGTPEHPQPCPSWATHTPMKARQAETLGLFFPLLHRIHWAGVCGPHPMTYVKSRDSSSHSSITASQLTLGYSPSHPQSLRH